MLLIGSGPELDSVSLTNDGTTIPSGGLSLVVTFVSPVSAGSGSPTLTVSGRAATLGSPVLTDSGRTWTYPVTNGNIANNLILSNTVVSVYAAQGVWLMANGTPNSAITDSSTNSSTVNVVGAIYNIIDVPLGCYPRELTGQDRLLRGEDTFNILNAR